MAAQDDIQEMKVADVQKLAEAGNKQAKKAMKELNTLRTAAESMTRTTLEDGAVVCILTTSDND